MQVSKTILTGTHSEICNYSTSLISLKTNLVHLKMIVSNPQKKEAISIFKVASIFQVKHPEKKTPQLFGPTEFEASVGWKEEGPSQKG